MSGRRSIHRPTKPKRSHRVAARARRTKAPRPTPERPLIVSASELKDFLRCRVRWNWRHQLRVVPKKKSVNLALGSLVHSILEGWYGLPTKRRTQKGMERVVDGILSDTHPEELTEKDLELVRAMCVGYAAWARPRDKTIGITRIQPELWFEEPLNEDGSIIVRGKIDAAFPVGSLKKTMGCFEHKTKAQIKLDVVDMNLQLSVYLWALRQKFPKARRYIAYYNVLRKQMPGPRVKADLFARESVERTSDEIQQWVIDTERAVLDMVDAAIYPNPMDACSWDCDYQVPCMMRGRAKDLAYVMKRDFVPKESY